MSAGVGKSQKRGVTGGQACPCVSNNDLGKSVNEWFSIQHLLLGPNWSTWVKYVSCIPEQLFAVVRDYSVNLHNYIFSLFHNFIYNAYNGLNFFVLNYFGPNRSKLHVRPYTECIIHLCVLQDPRCPSLPMSLPSPTEAHPKRPIPCSPGRKHHFMG